MPSGMASAATTPAGALAVPRHLSAAVGAVAALAAVVTFLGWALGLPRLTDWFGLGVTMKANAALALCALGSGLLFYALGRGAWRVYRVLAVIAAAIGAATLTQHLTGLDLGIDTLLFDEPRGAPGTASPGRMGPPASLSFLLLGVALGVLPRRETLAASLSLIVLGVSALSLVGYGYGAVVMYTIPRLTGISLQMALLLATASVGILLAAPRAMPTRIFLEPGSARTLATRLIPAAILIPIATGWLRLLGQREGFYDTEFGASLRTIVEMILFSALAWWAVHAIRERDLSRERAEAERDLVEGKFRAVIDASAVPFTVLEPVREGGRITDFRWSYLNSAAAAAIGREARELIGTPMRMVMKGSWDDPGVFERYVAVAERGAIAMFEIHSHESEVDGWYQVVASPFDEQVAVWFADMTERKRHELALRDADRRKDEFLATLAHELRNPLAPIRQAALLSRNPTIDDGQRRWCSDVIERQLHHMSLLLDDLLDVSRITRGTLELRRSPNRVQGIIQSAIETSRALIDNRKLDLEVAMPEHDVIANVDPLRLSQVVANLLNNAAKYTDRHGSIQLSVLVEGADLTIRVTDSGIGLAAEHLEEIFRMFSQVSSSRERADGGLGIGLALTRGLVELHGGRIEARSRGLGCGSTFEVRLPGVVVPVESPDVNMLPARSADAAQHRRILIADDNRDAADSLRQLLELEGHEVRVAYDGEAALAIAAEFAPDVALLDLGMPKRSGHEVATSLSAAAGERPLLVAITGWGQESDRERSARAGFDHHLTKPVDYESLLSLISRTRSRRR